MKKQYQEPEWIRISLAVGDVLTQSTGDPANMEVGDDDTVGAF